jgi:hypothetical protein
MTTTTTPQIKTERYTDANIGAEFRWEAVNEPGTYYSKWSGHLIRVPEYALKPGFSPVIEILGKEPMTVVRLSGDPFMPLSKCRMVAADLDLVVNF